MIQGKIEKTSLQCTHCTKVLSSKYNFTYHLNICKKAKISDIEDQLHTLKNQFEERLKHLEETKSIAPSTTNNIVNDHSTNTVNNHVTIHNYMTPERVTEVFDKHYTIEKLMGGQKALADFIVDQFVAGKDKMVYLCVDRSRKKCCYTTDFQTFHEDVNNDMLLSHMTPAFRIMKDRVEWSSFEKKYNPYFEKIHGSYDEILAIRTDGIPFRTQLCRRLPSTLHEKEIMDHTQTSLPDLDELRRMAEKNFREVKEEMEFMADKEFVEEPDHETHMEW